MRIGPDFRESHELADGTAVTLRHIRPDDREALRRGIQSLSPESRYARFLGDAQNLSEAMLTYLSDVDGIDHVAIVAVADSFDLKTDRPLGVARFVRVKDEPDAAEAALAVADSAQGKGLGKLMMTTLAHAARERGITKFHGDVLVSNEKMRHMLDKVGADIRPTEDGTIEFYVGIAKHEDPSLLDVLVDGFLRFTGRRAPE